MPYQISIQSHFDSAHHLVGYQGICQYNHGHRFLCQVTIEGNELDSRGILIDFKVIKDILGEIIKRFDHHNLNDIAPFNEGWQNNPTAENLAKYIYNQMRELKGLKKVRVYESPDCFAEYWE